MPLRPDKHAIMMQRGSVAPGSIAVVGAGLGGLTAALALLRKGWHVRVYEAAPMLGEVGAGISIAAGTGRGLAALGIGPALLAASLPVPAVAFAHYRTGELLAGVYDQGAPVDRGFATARHIHRADLHSILLGAVRAIDPDAVLTGKRLVDAGQDSDHAHARFADGSVIRADLLIGADGSRSAVRRALFDQDDPQFSGQVAFRCLVPIDRAAPFMGRGNAVVSIGAARMFHRYLVRGGSLVNVIGIGQNDHWREEGWNTPASTAEFLAGYADFHPDVTGLIAAAPVDSLIKWGLFVRPPLARWNKGRVLLLGDAAHPILPFLGLGAALAIEDGVVLARALAATPDLAPALDAYHAARLERVDLVRTQTLRQGEIIQSADPDAHGMDASPSQNGALFDYDPTTVPIHV
jgi:salicylate hydroxylase